MPLNYVREGIQPFIQDMTVPYVCSNAFSRMPLLAFLQMKAGGPFEKSERQLGLPKLASILSGMPISKARKEQLMGGKIYVDIHTATSDNTKEMGLRDTRPTVTTSQDQNYGQACFHKSRLITPIKVSHQAIKEAMRLGNASGADRAIKNVWRKATEEALGVHAAAQHLRLWFGGAIRPSDSVDYTFNQSAFPWPRNLGTLAAMSADNWYGQINRATLASGAAWKGKRVTTAMAADIFEILDEANIGQSCADSGVGDGSITLGLCTAAQFRRYKRQARREGMKYWPSGVPEMAQIGFKQEVIQVDNTYVTYDPLCPAGYFAGFNLGTWMVCADKEDNWRVTEAQSMCDNGQSGGEEADKADVITESAVICTAPYANCLFTGISES